jgi:hypothetical protein
MVTADVDGRGDLEPGLIGTFVERKRAEPVLRLQPKG